MNNKNNKKPESPKLIRQNKYFRIGIRDSARVRIIKEGMNHLFDVRNHEMEDAFYFEALQYTERIIGETRRIHTNEEEDQEAMNMIFGGIEPIDQGETEEEVISGEEEERLEREAEEPEEEAEAEGSETDSEEVLALQERIEAEDQEEYDRIRAEMEEEEAEANKNN